MEKQSYEDIIHLKRPVSNFPKASIEDRAAQFSAFEALTGHEEAVTETARLTEKKPILSESAIQMLDETMQELLRMGGQNVSVFIAYFVKDARKEGGFIKEIIDDVRKIDSYEKVIHLQGGETIPIADILDMEIYREA